MSTKPETSAPPLLPRGRSVSEHSGIFDATTLSENEDRKEQLDVDPTTLSENEDKKDQLGVDNMMSLTQEAEDDRSGLQSYCRSVDASPPKYEYPAVFADLIGKESWKKLMSVGVKDYSEKVHEDCPNCHTCFWNSTIVKKENGHLHLVCVNCILLYKLQNTTDQRKKLKSGSIFPQTFQELNDINGIMAGDVVALRRQNFRYHHCILLTAVDRDEKTISYVEIGKACSAYKCKFEKKVKQQFGTLSAENPFVLKFLPGDCKMLDEILKRIENLEELDIPIKYDPVCQNCQHLVMGLKTGCWLSFEEQKVEYWKHLFFGFADGCYKAALVVQTGRLLFRAGRYGWSLLFPSR